MEIQRSHDGKLVRSANTERVRYWQWWIYNENFDRQSGIELLKIIAIFLIVISHVTQSLENESLQFGIIHLGQATTDIQILILTLLRQAGVLGNNIFFVSSAWFLVEKTGYGRRKAFSILCTVWGISILMLSIYLCVGPYALTMSDIIKQILPTCFANNWYMTCYIIFLFIYPWLNKLLALTDQKQMWPWHASEVRNLTKREFRWLLEGLAIDQPNAIRQSREKHDFWALAMLHKLSKIALSYPAGRPAQPRKYVLSAV